MEESGSRDPRSPLIGRRVVLAGDHMQLQPSLTSATARAKRLGVSLLERLYYLYPADWPTKVLYCTVLYCTVLAPLGAAVRELPQQRAHHLLHQRHVLPAEAGGQRPAARSHLLAPPHLLHSQVQEPCGNVTPCINHVRGEDCQDSASTSFYNNSEVAEIVDRLAELRRNWPEAWGKKEECEIGVLTPYHDQVSCNWWRAGHVTSH